MDRHSAREGEQSLNWPTRLAMLAGGIMVTIAMSALTPVLPQIETALARGPDEAFKVKMVVPIIGLAMVIGAPLTGYLSDRLSLRILLLGNSLLFVVAGTAGFYLPGLNAVLASRLLVGLAAAGIATISMTLINTRLDGNARARWMGFHVSSALLGGLLLQPAVGALGEIGWRWPFLAYGAGIVVTIVALLDLQTPSRDKAAGIERTRDANPFRWFPLAFLPLALVIGSVTYLPTVYMPFVVREIGVTSPMVISMLMLADIILAATMSFFFGRFQGRITSRGAFIFSFGCTGCGMLIASQAASFDVLVAGMLVFGFGLGWFVPNMMTALSRRVAATHQGQAVGIVKAAHFLGSPLGAVAVEPIVRTWGPSGAMMASAVVSFCMVAVFVATGILGRRVAASQRDALPAE